MNENKSGLCTAALVFGIISVATCLLLNLGFLPGVVGLILSIVALVKKKEPRGRAKGGLITSIIGLVVGSIGAIIAVILIVTSGILVGGALGAVTAAANELASGDIDSDEFINIINNLDDVDTTGDDYNFDDLLNGPDYPDNLPDGDFNVNPDDYQDYLSIFDGTDYEDWFSYDEDGNPVMTIPDDVSGSGSGSSGSYDDGGMYIGSTYFEDLEDYGFTYYHGDSTYVCYTNDNGAEIEFPAFVKDYKAFGNTKFEAYDNYITKLGVKDYADEDGFYYDTKLYDDISDEWEYAYADLVDDYGGYQNYEIWLFAFNKVNDDMVILICRPTKDNFEEDFDDFIKTMRYMHPQ